MDDITSSSSSEQPGSEEEMGSWVSWFCSLKGNEFFCEIDEDYIQDDFNLSGLSSQVPYYDYALELILDAESANDEILTEAQQAAVEAAAEALYGLIHARYILTARGLAAMADKFKSCDFGRCPRVFCNSQPCLPVGLSDVVRQSTVKLFCPKCEDAFYPRSKYHGNLDGAYFGKTFPHLFLLTYNQLRPPRPTEEYVPKIFGFKIHPTAYNRDTVPSSGGNSNRQQQQQQKAAAAGTSKRKEEAVASPGGPAPMTESSVPEFEGGQQPDGSEMQQEGGGGGSGKQQRENGGKGGSAGGNTSKGDGNQNSGGKKSGSRR